MSQQYSLRWNNHQPNFISMFGNLLATKDLVDVTLAAEGQHLVAHKVVLSACSTYFHSLFVDNPTHHPIVILKDITFNDLRTMVDFMYYGEVNVTEQQLAQVLETAKILKIKGLTEMPDSTSLTRSQGIPTDFPPTETSNDTQRPSVSPSSPIRKKRQRKSSSGSLANPEELMQNVDMMRDAVTLSSLNIQKKREMDERMENSQQTEDPSAINIDQLAIDTNSVGMSQGAQWNMMEHPYPRYTNAGIGGGGLQPEQAMYVNNVIHQHGDDMSHYGHTLGSTGPVPGPSVLQGMNDQVGQAHSSGSLASPSGGRLRRSKYFKRQNRVQPEEREVRKQISEPTPSTGAPILQKHESYPQYSSSKTNRKPRTEHAVGSLLIRAVAVVDRQSSGSSATGSTSSAAQTDSAEASQTLRSSHADSVDAAHTQRASHTPAVRSGPPLSCNFCWNTVDECGRILRRKTQYHCPECRTNLCIVPCFHEYHDSNGDVPASAR